MQEYGSEVQKIKRNYKPGLSCLLITCPLGHRASTTWCCLFRNSALHSWRIAYLPFKISPAYSKPIKEYLSLVAVGTWNNIYSPPADLSWAIWHWNRNAFQLGSQATSYGSSQGTATVYSYVIACLDFEISSSYHKESIWIESMELPDTQKSFRLIYSDYTKWYSVINCKADFN